MEKIVRLKGTTKGELKQVNAVRLWMRVVTMADMANKMGTDIMDNMMCGQWRSGTDLKWTKEHCRGRNVGQHSEAAWDKRSHPKHDQTNQIINYGLKLKT